MLETTITVEEQAAKDFADLRDKAALAALPECMSTIRRGAMDRPNAQHQTQIAQLAYEIADAFMAAR